VHVSRPPVAHVFCPAEQVLVQLAAHVALPAAPVQEGVGDTHPVLDCTKRQPLPSVAHVASVVPFSHAPPFVVQMLASHVHAGVVVPVHVWFTPHVVVVIHAVQPFACVSQVCTPPVPHCFAPAVQAFVQHDADPALPVHAPFVHACEPVWSRQPFASVAHVMSVEAFEQSVPAAVHAVVLHVHAAEPAVPVHAWFAPHVCVPETLRHPLASATHVARVVPLSQTLPDRALQFGSLLHVHDAEPAAPLHTSSEEHATGVPYSRHPLVPCAHVARPPLMHAFCPAVHVPHAVHAALPAAPVHAGVGDEHGVVCETKRQWFVSVAQVASTDALSQTPPFWVQVVALHSHDAAPPVTTQV